jgi:hypothetical protein
MLFFKLRNVSSKVEISLSKGSYPRRMRVEYKTEDPISRKTKQPERSPLYTHC